MRNNDLERYEKDRNVESGEAVSFPSVFFPSKWEWTAVLCREPKNLVNFGLVECQVLNN